MEWLTTSTILRDLADFANDSAWREFAERFRPPIMRFARKLGLSEPDCEEVAQESLTAFAAAYRDGRYDRDKGRLSQWLFGIAYRQAVSARRKGARLAATESPAPATSFWAELPDEDAGRRIWDEQWEHAVLELCLRHVRQEVEPATMRTFELLMRSEVSPAEVARNLGVPVKAVYNARYTVLKRIRELRAGLEELV